MCRRVVRRGAAGLWSLVLLAAGFLAAVLVLFPAQALPVRAEAQTAADAAALAAAAELPNGQEAARSAAGRYAAANGADAAVGFGEWKGVAAVQVVVSRGAARAGATAVLDRGRPRLVN